MTGVVIGVSTSIIATGITFYLKDYLKERAKFKKFEAKLKEIAGKEAEVIIPNIGIVKITDINRQGITVKNELCTTFLPMERVLLTDIAIPVENYEGLRKELMRKNVEESLDIVFPPLMDKLKEVMVKEFLRTDSELSAVIALKVRGEMKEEGILAKKRPKEKELSFREIAEQMEKAETKEKTRSTKEKESS
jgi:hypothetical protein